MGCARDIVEHAGVPRFYYSEFPLGNSAGKPGDIESQRATMRGALDLFATATGPRTTTISPQRWADDDAWQDDFLNIDALSDEQIARLRDEFSAQKATARRLKTP